MCSLSTHLSIDIHILSHRNRFFLAIMKNAAVNVQVWVFVWTSVPFRLSMYLGVESLGPMVTLSVFNILRNCQTFLKWPSHFTVPIFFLKQ